MGWFNPCNENDCRRFEGMKDNFSVGDRRFNVDSSVGNFNVRSTPVDNTFDVGVSWTIIDGIFIKLVVGVLGD